MTRRSSVVLMLALNAATAACGSLVRKVTKNCALFAIRNGGFSSGPMPQNIVTGPEAEELAAFLAKFSGLDAPAQTGPQSASRDCPAA